MRNESICDDSISWSLGVELYEDMDRKAEERLDVNGTRSLCEVALIE